MKVLVVDDELFVLNTLERFITNIGHTPIMAEDGNSAVRLYKHHKPDIVLMDIMLKGKKGGVAFKEIMEFDKKANIVFITGSFDEYTMIEGPNKPECFVKPIDIMKIKEIIEMHEPRQDE